MNTSFFTGESVRLRAMEPEDLDLMYAIENDPELWDVSNFSVPYSKYVLKEYIANSQYDMFADKQLRMMVVRKADDEVVGTVDITDFAPLHLRGEVGMRLHQLTAHIALDNEQSLGLFKACGFSVCGVLKEWWRVKGTFKDVALLQRLHP